MTVMPKNIAIIGPTASGKSSLATAVAHAIGGEIISVDSMQVYRGMNVGTAKPTDAERAAIVHHAIDLLDPDAEFSVANFVNLADAIIRDAQERAAPLVIAGGTPMYFKALFDGLFEGPSADAALRAKLNSEPLESLHGRLQQIDPAAAERIHLNDRRRIVRALEVFEITGRPISSMQTDWASESQRRHDAIWFGLTWESDELNRRINARVKQMIRDGWLDEVRGLVARFPTLSKTAGEATGYAGLIDHLTGKSSLDDAIEQIKIATRQLARRQMKWFRRFPSVTWLDGRKPVEELAVEVIARRNQVCPGQD